jgi:hypothetical protein
MARAAAKTTCTGDRGGVLLTAALAWINELVSKGLCVYFETGPGGVGMWMYEPEAGLEGIDKQLGKGADVQQAIVNAFCASVRVSPAAARAQGGAA